MPKGKIVTSLFVCFMEGVETGISDLKRAIHEGLGVEEGKKRREGDGRWCVCVCVPTHPRHSKQPNLPKETTGYKTREADAELWLIKRKT